MTRRRSIADLLQECLAGFDAGLSPEECLSAFPERRSELEPLFRRALSTRITLTASPRPQFRERAKDSLLFAAGRDVRAALAAEPDFDFVHNVRERLLRAGGEAVHESLRAVPPPRLAFWVNAKRNLLEAAQQPPAPRAARQPLGVGLRAALSAAVVVLALSLAGLAYLTASGPQPNSVSAQYELLNQELSSLEAQARAGVNIQPSVINDLSQRTTNLISQIEGSGGDPLVDKLPEIIQRQQEIVLAATETSLSPELEQAQLQLNDAAVKVEEIRLAGITAVEEPDSATATEPVAAEGAALEQPTATPEAVDEEVNLLPEGIVVISALPEDTTFDLSWKLVQTRNLSLVIPEDWRITVPEINADGIGALEVSTIRADADDLVLLIQVDSGSMHAIVGGEVFVLRTEGTDGQLIGPEELVAIEGAPVLALSHVVESFSVTGELSP